MSQKLAEADQSRFPTLNPSAQPSIRFSRLSQQNDVNLYIGKLHSCYPNGLVFLNLTLMRRGKVWDLDETVKHCIEELAQYQQTEQNIQNEDKAVLSHFKNDTRCHAAMPRYEQEMPFNTT